MRDRATRVKMPFMFGLSLFYVVVLLLVWLVSAGVAAVVSPPRRGLEFFLITFFFLGPLGCTAHDGRKSRAKTQPQPEDAADLLQDAASSRPWDAR
jgi:bacteriorhodopsin